MNSWCRSAELEESKLSDLDKMLRVQFLAPKPLTFGLLPEII